MLKRLWRKFHSKHLEKRKLRFVRWFEDKTKGKYCWADCVSYAYDPFKINPLTIETSGGCREESKNGNTCYCGKFHDGRYWCEIPEKEKNEILGVGVNDDFPLPDSF